MDVYNFREMPLAVVQPGFRRGPAAGRAHRDGRGRRAGAARRRCLIHRRVPARHGQVRADRYRAHEPRARDQRAGHVRDRRARHHLGGYDGGAGREGLAHGILGAVLRAQGDRRRLDVAEQRQPRVRQLRLFGRYGVVLRHRAGQRRAAEHRLEGAEYGLAILSALRARSDRHLSPATPGRSASRRASRCGWCPRRSTPAPRRSVSTTSIRCRMAWPPPRAPAWWPTTSASTRNCSRASSAAPARRMPSRPCSPC